MFLKGLFLLFFSFLPLQSEEGIDPDLNGAESIAERSINPAQIPYLIQKNDLKKALDLYRSYYEQQKRHDFEILEQLGTILLEKGALETAPEIQLLSLYGSLYASLSSKLSVVEAALKSPHLPTQLAALHLIGRLHDDRCSTLLHLAMTSDFLYTRMEAAYQLALRKNPGAVGQIESLMFRVPPALRSYFPSFFALIGTPDATKILKGLLEASDEQVRIEAILSTASHGREELLPLIRSMATHPGPLVQEATAFALGELKDSHSLSKLRRLSLSSFVPIRIAACRSLYLLGEKEVQGVIEELAQKENLFAIQLLGEMEGSNAVLVSLLDSRNLHVRFNSALSLLKKRDPRAAPQLKELLIRDTRDFGFYPIYTPGRALMAWKILPSLDQQQQNIPYDLKGMTLAFREKILRDALELPETEFLMLAEALFTSRQTELIPLLVRLLENLESKEASLLLKRQQRAAGAPLIRSYCNLSLFRLKEKGPYEEGVRSWVERNKGKELIRFREITPKRMKGSDSPYELTPEERSRLFIETLEALAQSDNARSIDLFLNLIEKGNPKNRYVLAGLLLKALH
ncbi:MAG: hypothetical protein A2Y28_01760 [Chlamydiae bacterium GWC2_50_10]|nr:MAG: hypothetical protein A2Z85_02425 [Chlamydiae bacterium GWA2_50_15]OGN53545.1 MAG: hypothetical protein A2Y28_01760 [Chlamydiae bacterium GWC2_50_10]OGN58127.1 MAG: hypothetical protein A3D18_05775 [Chlamydiae bacterium RIFCSPHIGHO2_02_FULL_49_29]OGN64530.1 MAG: hypothetical protein A3E26_01235 [Chlamydiae bacterium RIFCSPHIGHO2_12_FULL_49_32]OGN69419.1 MAG: hypothetical protein A3I15_06070 [Chlamydiae bacterium RIFCSPLOWO2_02_FULL_49_12]OGN75452.1 MAG: hypothetical protein A3G30_02300 